MHHLILVRENDRQSPGCGCCGRLRPEDVRLGPAPECRPEPDERMARFGELYRALRDAFGASLEITVLDPRNVVSFAPLVVRDAIRYRVPFGTALRALTSTSFATGVLDGQLLFSGTAPPPDEVVAVVAGRLEIDRVGVS